MEWCDLSIKVFLYVRFKSNNDCKVLSTVPGIQMVSVWCHICSSNHAVLEVERNKLFWDCLWRHPRERGHCQEDIKNYFFLPPRSNSILKKNVVLWYLATISHGSKTPIFQFFSHLHFTYTKLGYLKRMGFPSLRCGASEVFRTAWASVQYLRQNYLGIKDKTCLPTRDYLTLVCIIGEKFPVWVYISEISWKEYIKLP